MTIAIGMLAALGAVGWWLWSAATDREQAKSGLGTGVLVSVVVAAAVGGAQFAIDERRNDLDQQRQKAAEREAEQQRLLLTLGLQQRLVGIDLRGRDLTGFVLSGKDVRRGYLVDASLRRADLSNVIFRGANLTGADLRSANADGADLRGAGLPAARLDGASLVHAKFGRADLPGASLRQATLRNASFRGANLVGADLSQANLLLADLRGASLQEADLRGANVVGARMQDATYDSRTRFPKGLDPEAEGANALATACTLPHHVVNLRFSRAKYPNIATQTRSAISRGWPSIMVLNRPAVRARVERLFSGLDRLDTLGQNQYPPSIGRGRPNGERRGLIRGVDPLGWMADIRAVPSAENRSQGFVLGVRLARFCDGTRFRFVFR